MLRLAPRSRWWREHKAATEHGSRLGKAQDAVDRAVKLAPRNSIAYHRRARPLRTRSDLDGAIAANAHALALNPNLAEAHAELARSKIDTGLAHEDEARALIKEHLSDGNGLTISRWIKRFSPRGGVVAEQRARIVGLLRGPGVPEGKIQTGSVK